MPLYLWWGIKFLGLVLVSYELFLIITNENKKLSIIGTIVLTFSGTVQWNINSIDALIIGELITVLVHKFLNKDRISEKIIISICIILGSVIYMFTFRPYAVSFGYLFLALILWIALKNKEKLKDKKIYILGSLTGILIIIGMVVAGVYFNNNNVEYSDINMKGISIFFSYLYNFLLPFNRFDGQELFASVVSVFPLPMFIALYYLYKKEKHMEFLLPITTVTVLETVFCISGFPEIVSKITFFSEVISLRAIASVQISNLFIMFYFLANVDEELFKMKSAMRITIVCACILVFIKLPVIYSAKIFIYLFAAEISLLSFLFLNFNEKKYQKVLLFFLVLITLIGGVPVNFLS